ncbi:glutamine ABC transporter substrate-binding protein GlnH [Desulfoplanes formicivorans]|uniref:Glutamine ABC transporter substrate-bindnig protein n=1 Tax=Desulfoplanes formicivorans TaxID=1592317 RepID=A0A194AH60_9BACT|nr:glutamine ABC transporter substrate-binding protein GlnH [Desulfoplanes formicivorans]GAU08099.1 glutamine ABC transporter substrate-bindnig protein [Desulfoplanes formicivorans]
MQRIAIVLLAGLMLCCLAGNAAAKKLVVACDTAFMPFEYKDTKTGKYVGFDIDLWDAVAKDLGLEYELQPMAFNGIVPALQTGNVDVGIAGMTIKSQRMEVIDFAYPYYQSGLRLLVRSDNTDIKSVEDLKDKVVATKIGTSSVDFVKPYTTKPIRKFQDQDAAFMELRSGGADAVIFDKPVVEYYAKDAGKDAVKVVGPVYAGQYYGIGFPQGSPLRKKVSISILKLMESGEYAKIYKKWFGVDPL